MSLTWVCKKFEDLTSHELYAIIRLRNAVFVVEQNCVFQDADKSCCTRGIGQSNMATDRDWDG